MPVGRDTAAYCLVDIMDGIEEAGVGVRVGRRGKARLDGLRAEPKPRAAGHLSLRGMLRWWCLVSLGLLCRGIGKSIWNWSSCAW